jgi:hypothetical protein
MVNGNSWKHLLTFWVWGSTLDFSNSPGLTQNTTQHADRPQHTFSLDAGPSLHLALPALEALHKAWSAQLCKDKYLPFTTTLQAAIDKITEYYKKTADSDVVILAMSQFHLASHSIYSWCHFQSTQSKPKDASF